MTTINDTYINALLADSSYITLHQYDEINKIILPELLTFPKQLKALTPSLTEPQAKYVIDNFEVLNQELSPVGGFDAVVWRGRAGTEFAGKVYISMRGTQGGTDIADDIELLTQGVPSNQIVSMVNWWLRETAVKGTVVKQIKEIEVSTLTGSGTTQSYALSETNAIGTGILKGIDSIESVNDSNWSIVA